MPITLSETRVRIAGVEVAVVRFGDPSGRPILALHGWLDNAMSFAPLAEALDPAYQIIAPDLVGHGRSGRRGTGYHDVEWAADALALIDALRLDRPVLLGHSLGAKIAALAACAADLRGLVLIEALGLAHVPPAALPSRLSRYAKLRTKYRDKPPRPLPRDAAIARMVETGVALSEVAAARLAERGLVEVDGGFAPAADPLLHIFSPAALGEAQVLAALAAIRCPTLLFTATSGFGFDRQSFEAQKAVVPRLEHLVLEGRHYVHMDDPAPLARALEARLRAWGAGEEAP